MWGGDAWRGGLNVGVVGRQDVIHLQTLGIPFYKGKIAIAYIHFHFHLLYEVECDIGAEGTTITVS